MCVCVCVLFQCFYRNFICRISLLEPSIHFIFILFEIVEWNRLPLMNAAKRNWWLFVLLFCLISVICKQLYHFVYENIYLNRFSDDGKLQIYSSLSCRFQLFCSFWRMYPFAHEFNNKHVYFSFYFNFLGLLLTMYRKSKILR